LEPPGVRERSGGGIRRSGISEHLRTYIHIRAFSISKGRAPATKHWTTQPGQTRLRREKLRTHPVESQRRRLNARDGEIGLSRTALPEADRARGRSFSYRLEQSVDVSALNENGIGAKAHSCSEARRKSGGITRVPRWRESLLL
jgi:hypothetical protein